MKLLKIIFVGSLLLLMSATPLLAATDVKEETRSSPINSSDEHYLGHFNIIHQAWLFKGPLLSRVEFTPDSNNPTLEFEFPEDENGYVDMEFTVNVTHKLNDAGISYFASWIWPNNHRFTLIKLWINHDGVDYIINLNTTNCNTFFTEEYEITISGGEPLKTDGETLECLFWWLVNPGVTPIEAFHQIMPLVPKRITGADDGSETIYVTGIPT